MRKIVVVYCVIAMSIAVSACASPSVKYIKDPSEDKEGHIKFHLVGSNVLITRAKEDTENKGSTKLDVTANTTKVSASDVSAAVIPRESTSGLFAVVPHSSWLWLVKTNLSATFYDNSRLIKQIGVSVEDNRLKAIQAIGAIAGAAVCFAASAVPPTLNVPIVIDPYEAGTEWKALPSNEGWVYRSYFNVPPTDKEETDAMSVDSFFAKYSEDGWFNSTAVFPVSSCRGVVLKLRPLPELEISLMTKNDGESDADFARRKAEIQQKIEETKARIPIKDGEDQASYSHRVGALTLDTYTSSRTRTFPLQISDNRFVRTLRFPDKGSITTHTICGADTKNEGSQVVGYQDLLGELIKQAKTVYEAQKEKNKDKK